MNTSNKMSVVVVFLIFLFGVIDQENLVISKHKQTREALEATYMKLQDLGTGYQLEKTYTTDELSKLNVSMIKNELKHLYQNILCSYVFMAIHHLRLLEYFVHSSNVQKIPCDMLFFDEAQMMLTVAYSYTDISNDKMRTIWLIYTYELYLKSICYNEIKSAKDAFPNVHVTVIAKLQDSTKDNCKPNNIFDGLYEDSPYHKQLKSVTTSKNVSALNKYKIINDKKKTINVLIRHQEEALHLTYKDEQRFSMSAIFLNRLFERKEVMINLLRDFGEQGADSYEMFLLIKKEFSEVMSEYHLDRWAKRLGDFLNNFIDFLKIIMLRIICMHVVKLEHYLSTNNILPWCPRPSVLLNSNKPMTILLKDFVEYLDLKEDPSLRYVVDIFSKPVLHFLSSNMRLTIIKEIVNKINELSQAFQRLNISCPTTKTDGDNYIPITSLAAAEKISIRNFLETTNTRIMCNTVKIAYYYVGYIKKMLVDIDIKVIKTFIEFTKNIEDIFAK